MDEKIQSQMIYPAKVRVVPNCKLAKISGNRTEKQYNRLLDGKNFTVVEKKKSKKHDEITSTFTISNADGYDGTDPLTFFDYSVLSVCISEQLEGNPCTTAAVILRGLTGKVAQNAEIHPDQRAAIMASVRKMMNTNIRIDNSAANKELGYEGEKIIERQLLPAYFETTIINGQAVEDVIYFYHDNKGNIIKSPIFEVAAQRSQIIRYDTALLDVPNQNNTPLVIALKNYVILRVMEIKKHKMTPSLTFEDIFKKCRIDGASTKVKFDARNCVVKFFEHLQEKGIIKTFELRKKSRNFHGIAFTF